MFSGWWGNKLPRWEQHWMPAARYDAHWEEDEEDPRWRQSETFQLSGKSNYREYISSTLIYFGHDRFEVFGNLIYFRVLFSPLPIKSRLDGCKKIAGKLLSRTLAIACSFSFQLFSSSLRQKTLDMVNLWLSHKELFAASSSTSHVASAATTPCVSTKFPGELVQPSRDSNWFLMARKCLAFPNWLSYIH